MTYKIDLAGALACIGAVLLALGVLPFTAPVVGLLIFLTTVEFSATWTR